MENWKPDVANDQSPIRRGPPTRRIQFGKKSPGRRALRYLRRFSGEKLATWANRAIRRYGASGLKISYDAEQSLYISTEDGQHAFAHPQRLWTVFYGHRSRGKRLAYEYLLDQIDFKDDDVVIDVGANAGDLGLAFKALNVQVEMHAFEPSPGEYTALCFNLERCSAVRSYTTHQVALWNADSEGLTFYLAPGSADSSILPFPGSVGEVKVPGRTLDSILSAAERRFKLLKLEAEGAEPEILEGAATLLPSIDYVTVDVGFERGENAESTLPQIANTLLANGFEIIGYEGWRHVVLFKNKAAA